MIIKNIAHLTIISFVILSTKLSAATNHDFSLSNAEQVTFLTNTLNTPNSDTKYILFSSLGQKFDLVLHEKNQLMNGFSTKQKDIKLYAGKIQGNDKSWARITVIGDEYTGAIYNGSELYLLDLGKNINAALPKANMSHIKTVIYKASEVSTHLTCDNHDSHRPHDSEFSYENLLSHSTREQLSQVPNAIDDDLAIAAATASEQINLRIVTDPEYASSSSLSAEAQVISQMNIVDGIFSEQIGVQFGITDIEVLTNNGPLTSTSASGLLNEFRTFIGNDNPGLAHLFTGRDIDSNTIGIAFLNSICRTSGVGLTQAGGRGTFGALTAAHEFGHNFGAPHDNQAGSICEASPGTFLMNPSLNGSDQFSQCSLQQISNTLQNAQCLVPVDNTPIEPVAPADNCDFSIDFANGDNNFNFINDPQTPVYSSSTVANGSINTILGGVDDNDITDIQGLWSRECVSSNGGSATFDLTASLTQSSEYEANEFSQIALRVNGTTTVLDTLTGDGNGGINPSTGTQQYSAEVLLNSGINTIDLMCFNNLKTLENENTECRFNRLEARSANDDLCIPIKTKDNKFVFVCI